MRAAKKRKKNKTRKIHSIRFQMSFTFILLMSSCILISIFASRVSIRKYYTDSQIKRLEEDYQIIEDMVESGAYDEGTEYLLEESKIKLLDRYSATDNLKIIIVNPNGDENYAYTTETSQQQLKRINQDLTKYLLDDFSKDERPKKLKEDNYYKIFLSKDMYIGSENVDLIGKLSNGYLCFIRMNYENIENTANLANDFYAKIGLVIILVEAIIIMISFRRFTKPIESMNRAAKRMKNLDFEVKTECKENNELGELSDSINSMSDTLKETILELKTANNELKHDLDKRVEIDEMRKDFVGNVSHELKTPIAIIQGYAEGLKELGDEPESREYYCEVIIDEAVKMNEMVKKLLSLNKIEYGESQLELERFDVSELVKGVLKASEVLAGDKEVSVDFKCDGSKFVYADEYMIEEAISNYVSNAYHYVDGENLIKVKIVDLGDKVRISVFNTGTPIPDEDLEKVWVKFYKVDKARTREYGGSGIGLSIVKAIMELHNEKCGVQNHDNGVEFWLELDSSTVSI